MPNERLSEQEATNAYNRAFEALRDCYGSFLAGYEVLSKNLQSLGKNQAEVDRGVRENQSIKKLVGIVVLAALRLQDRAVESGQSRPVADIDLALQLANEYGVSILDVVKSNLNLQIAPEIMEVQPPLTTELDQAELARTQEKKQKEARLQAENLLNQDKVDINQIADLPGMAALRKWLDIVGQEKQHHFHDFTLQKHTQELLDRLSPYCKKNKNLVLLLAGALHDIGKVGASMSRQKNLDPEGVGREPRHTEQSASIVAQEILPQIDWLDPSEKETLLYLVAHHDWLGDLAIYKNSTDSWKKQEVYRGNEYGVRLGQLARETSQIDDLFALLQLTMADIASIKTNGVLLNQEMTHQLFGAYYEVVEQLQRINAQTYQSESQKETAKIDEIYCGQMAKISRHESLTGQGRESIFNDVAPTHRCSLQAALGILESGALVSTEDRGVNFRVTGLGADYGYITLIGRSLDADVAHPDVRNGGSKHPFNILEMAGVGGASKVMDIFQKLKDYLPPDFNERRNQPGFTSYSKKLADVSRSLVGDFHDLAKIPVCLSGQFNIGMRDKDKQLYAQRIQMATTSMRRSPEQVTGVVPTEAIGAMLVPNFLRFDPEYQRLIVLAQQRGVEVIMTNTGQTALEYLGESAAYLLTRGGSYNSSIIGDLGTRVAKELSTKYHTQVTYQKYDNQSSEFESLLKRYLLENDFLRLNEANFSGAHIKSMIESANEGRRLHRGSRYSGQYINVVGKKAYLEEERAYFAYLARTQKQVSLAKLTQSN